VSKRKTNLPASTEAGWIKQSGSVMDRKQLRNLVTKSINDPIIPKEDLTNLRIVFFENDSSRLRKQIQAFHRRKHI